MEQKEFEVALEALESSIKSENKEVIEKSLESFEEKFGKQIADSSDEVKKLVNDLYEANEAKLTDKFNEYSAKMKEKMAEHNKGSETYTEKMRKAISENFDQIKEVRPGKSVELKAVADMLTTGDHVTGDYIRDYNRTPIVLPGHDLNVADLVPSITIDGGTYTYVRETAGEGSVAAPTEGSDKAKVDFDFSHIDVTTDFLAGITVYSKKMRNNLQYLQSFLPEALRKKYFIAENTAFNTVIANAATTSTNFIADVDNIAELIKEDVKDLDVARYSANAIVMNKADWYAILNTEKSTGAGYGLPFGFTYDNGTMRCLGIPVLKADWVGSHQVLRW